MIEMIYLVQSESDSNSDSSDSDSESSDPVFESSDFYLLPNGLPYNKDSFIF